MSKEKKLRYILMMGILILIFIGLFMGFTDITLKRIIEILIGNGTFKENYIVYQIRLPRVLTLILAGGALAISGNILQIITKNDLADTGVLGINSGAGLFVTILYLFIPTNSEKFIYILPLIALLGGILAGVLIFSFSYRKGEILNMKKLILIGLGFSMEFSGLMIILVSSAEKSKMEFIIKWLNGNVWGSNWSFIFAIFPWILLIFIYIYFKNKTIETLQLSDEMVISLGVNINKEKVKLVFLSIALASISVSAIGSISFLGLISPHISRVLIGRKIKNQLIFTFLIGTIFILFADLIGRNIFLPEGIPTGIVVALVGIPYFIYLINKK